MRSSKIDNYKVILTYLVVLGHVIGFMKFNSGIYAQNIIYSFHMPAFIFINGVLFKFLDYKKLLKLLMIFVVMQLFYLFYFRLVGYHSGSFNLWERMQQPAFHLWYLVAFISWVLLTGALIWIKRNLGTFFWKLMLVLVIFAAIGVRFINTDIPDQWLTYTRIFVFAPFFITGFYMKDMFKSIVVTPTLKLASVVFSLIGIGSLMYLTTIHLLPTGLFYGFSHLKSFPFTTTTFLILEIYQVIIASILLFAFYILTPDTKYSWTNVSANVTNIYLWHPMIAVLLIKVNFQQYSGKYNVTLAIIITTIIFYVLNRLICLNLQIDKNLLLLQSVPKQK